MGCCPISNLAQDLSQGKREYIQRFGTIVEIRNMINKKVCFITILVINFLK